MEVYTSHPYTGIAPPTLRSLPGWHIVTNEEPIVTHHCHPKSTGYIREIFFNKTLTLKKICQNNGILWQQIISLVTSITWYGVGLGCSVLGQILALFSGTQELNDSPEHKKLGGNSQNIYVGLSVSNACGASHHAPQPTKSGTKAVGRFSAANRKFSFSASSLS